MLCQDCGSILTDDERHYYETRCERCETEDHSRIVAWRNGADAPELDERYDDRPAKGQLH